VGILPDIRKAVTLDLKQPGNPLFLVGNTLPKLGGSEYYRLKGFLGKTVPQVDANQARKTVESVVSVIDAGFVRACHDLSEGGLAVAAAEMALASNNGLELSLKDVPKPKSLIRNDFVLFSESNSRFLVEVGQKHTQDFYELMRTISCAMIGRVTKKATLTIRGANGKNLVETDLAALRKAWKTPLGAIAYET
jgi:phosphoribosylformylglycinamidine synthase